MACAAVETSNVGVPMKRLQRADKFLGFLACALLQPLRFLRRRPRPSRPPRKVLLVKMWGIGSLQMMTPAVDVLRRDLPGARLVLLTLKENEAFARGLCAFDDVRTLDVRVGSGLLGGVQLLARLLRSMLALRRGSFDRVYDFEFFTRFSALVSLASGARATFGFAAPGVWRGGFHTHTLPFNRYWHVSRNFRALAGGEDGEDVESLAPFPVRSEDRSAVLERLDRAGVPADRPFAVLNPNAGVLALERRWPACRYAALVEFTTGYGPRSGGRRRPHWNLLLKGIPTAAADQVHELVGKVWCPRTDSRPDAQFVGAIAEVGGLMRYLALHFQKESQRPPRGWRGHRFLKSRDYLNVSTPEARLRARESLRFKRYVYDALQAGLPSALAEAWAEACQEDARATTWKAVQLHQLAGKEWIRPVVGRKAA